MSGHATLDAVSSKAARYDVELRTLDSYAFSNVALIKIDVEGRELDVLRGARETIVRWRPVLLVEIEQRHLAMPMREAFAEIEALGYAGSFLLDGVNRVPLSRFSAATHQSAANADRPRAHYINNFIFHARRQELTEQRCLSTARPTRGPLGP